MAHSEASPRAQLDEIEALVAGKDPYLVFELDSEGGHLGVAYLTAMEYPDIVTLHRWSTAEVKGDDSMAYLDCHWQGPYDEVKEYDPTERQTGIGRAVALLVDKSGSTEEVPVQYGGALSLEDVVAGALAWLKKHGSEEKHTPVMRMVAPATAMGFGFTILANHINNAALRAGYRF